MLLTLMVTVIPIKSEARSLMSGTQVASNMFNNVVETRKAGQNMSSFLQGLNKNSSKEETEDQVYGYLRNALKDSASVPGFAGNTAALSNVLITSNKTNSTDLLAGLTKSVTTLFGNGSSALKSYTPSEVLTINAETAGKRAGSKYNVKLSGNVYLNSKNSNKWVVFVHGFMMNGQAMADCLAEMYMAQGFNVFAPDLRGFGNSEGSVAMGYLESLDIWDWLTELNKKYTCNEIIIHGVSLGGATTVQISGLSVDGKTLKQQNVIGIVDDCGYASMTGIIKGMLGLDSDNQSNAKSETTAENILGLSKLSLNKVSTGDTLLQTALINLIGTGLTNENFDELQDGLKSLEKCEVPVLVIHGTSDTTVPYDNSDKIYNTALNNQNIPYVQRYAAEGQQHAFITLGMNYNVYEGHVEEFIKQAEKVKNGETVNKISNYKEEEPQKTSIITTLTKVLRLLKNILGI